MSNSLVGSHPLNYQTGFSDEVGGGGGTGLARADYGGGVTALANGNYVVFSPDWYGYTGAVTWGNGATGRPGTVSAANSLVGSYFGDDVGVAGVTALSNGNYVVDSPDWSSITGAVTWGDGTTGISGVVSAANSVIGSAVGASTGISGVTALPNGNYFVISPGWSGQGSEGAATWENGTTATLGPISSANSLIGIGDDVNYPTVLANGDYVVNTPSSATWTNGSTGTTLDGQNTMDAQNTISIGLTNSLSVPINSAGTLLLVGDTEFFTDPNLLTYALAQGQTMNITPSFITQGATQHQRHLAVQERYHHRQPHHRNAHGNPGSLTLHRPATSFSMQHQHRRQQPPTGRQRHRRRRRR